LLDLSLAVFLLDGPFPITDPVSFELGALAPSFFGNCLLHFTVSFYHLVGLAEPSLSALRFVGAPDFRRSSGHQSANCYTKWSMNLPIWH
jgi:hypothetical protein